MPDYFGVGTVLAVPRHRAVYDSGVYLADCLVVYAQALDHARSEWVDDNIRFLCQLIEDIAGFFRLQIEHDALLVPVNGRICGQRAVFFVS